MARAHTLAGDLAPRRTYPSTPHYLTALVPACRRAIGGNRRAFSVARQNDEGQPTEGFGRRRNVCLGEVNMRMID